MTNMKQILISGSNGLVGRELLRQLREIYPHEQIIAMDIIEDKELGIEYMNVTKKEDVYPFFETEDIGTVIHLAARVGGKPSEKYPYGYIHTNVMGTVTLLEAMRNHGVEKMIFMSSWSLYSPKTPMPIDEDTSISPKTPYGMSKVMAEGAVKVYAELYGIETVVFRPTMLYGPEQTENNHVQQILDCMITEDTFEIWGEGSHTRELLEVSDMTKIIIGGLNYEPEDGYEVFVVGTENPLSVVDVARAGQKLRPFEVKFVPSNKWVFSQSSDMTKIKTKMGVDPTTFKTIEEGLLDCLEFRETLK